MMKTEELVTRSEVEEMIGEAIKQTTRFILTELADSFKSAGEIDLYNYQSIESQCTAHTARELGDRIGWLLES